MTGTSQTVWIARPASLTWRRPPAGCPRVQVRGQLSHPAGVGCPSPCPSCSLYAQVDADQMHSSRKEESQVESQHNRLPVSLDPYALASAVVADTESIFTSPTSAGNGQRSTTLDGRQPSHRHRPCTEQALVSERATMYLMYYEDEEGNRVYTLKVRTKASLRAELRGAHLAHHPCAPSLRRPGPLQLPSRQYRSCVRGAHERASGQRGCSAHQLCVPSQDSCAVCIAVTLLLCASLACCACRRLTPAATQPSLPTQPGSLRMTSSRASG